MRQIKQITIKRYTVFVVIFVALLLLIYMNINPEDSAFFPKCTFFQLTGVECPSCGIQRALHAMLNGNYRKAFLYNPFLWLALPYVVGLIYGKLFNTKFSKILWQWLSHKYSVNLYILLYMTWWIVRNII